MSAAIGAIFAVALLAFLYFLPTMIAWKREHNVGGVFTVNLLIGWTAIGWVIALVMACGARRETVIQQVAASGQPRFDPYTGEPVDPS